MLQMQTKYRGRIDQPSATIQNYTFLKIIAKETEGRSPDQPHEVVQEDWEADAYDWEVWGGDCVELYAASARPEEADWRLDRVAKRWPG